jgi:glycosyltransferase involved in cell wall biosynthesis
MSVLARLQSVGVALCSDISQLRLDVMEPHSGSSPAPPSLVEPENPLVSCLMMTRGHIDVLRFSLACYRRQTYAHRELVVVAEPDAGDKVRAFMASQGIPNVTVFVAPHGLTIGDHRNIAAARARGAILVTWDDDDLSDPRRLDIAVQILRKTGAAAAFVSRLLVWWPQRKIAAISNRRTWEGSLAAWRNYMPIFAPLSRGGDTPPIHGLINTHRIARIDCPLMYVYVVTGRNTWGAPHFEKMLADAECVMDGDQFDELNNLLSDRLPVLDYAAAINDKTSSEQLVGFSATE